MKNVYIKSTSKTPEVNLDVVLGEFKIYGRSIIENPREFYDPIIDRIEEYSLKPQSKSVFDIYFEYLSTASSVCVIKIMTVIKKLRDAGQHINIIIRYDNDDPDMLEKFQAISQIVNIDAEFRPMARF